MTRTSPRARLGAALLLAAVPAALASGQAVDRAVFVANNGNLEGSVSSFIVDDDGGLTFVDRVVTGMRDSLSDPCPGCNAYAISVAPGGRYVATSHPASDDPFQQVSIFEVAADATLTQVGAFTVDSSPLDLDWVSDFHLAVIRTSLGGANEARVYAFDPDAPGGATLTFVDGADTGSFSSSLVVDRVNRRIYAGSSLGTSFITALRVNPDGTLDEIETVFTGGVYPLGLGLSPDGLRLYGGGGISSGGDKVLGYNVTPADGTLLPTPGAPYLSAGASPKQVVVSSDGGFALVAHGGDATIRVFASDGETGELTDTGALFDVGGQGALGGIAAAGGFVFATDRDTIGDGVRGVWSMSLGPGGMLTPNGPLADTFGITPNDVAAWIPIICAADLDRDGLIGTGDLLVLLAAWGDCGGCPADLDGSGAVDLPDLLELLARWGPCP